MEAGGSSGFDAVGIGADVVAGVGAELAGAGSLFSFLGRRRCRFGPAVAASFEAGVVTFCTGVELVAFPLPLCSLLSMMPPAGPARPDAFSLSSSVGPFCRACFDGDVVGPGDWVLVGIGLVLEGNRMAMDEISLNIESR